MWQNAELGWVSLAWHGAGDVAVVRGTSERARALYHGRIAAATWLPVWDRYRSACDAARASSFATFQGPHALAVAQAQRDLRTACTLVYEIVSEAAASDLGTERTVVVRTSQLRTLSLARVVAVARPEMLRARRLPWDLPVCDDVEQAPGLARATMRWLLPDPACLTIVAPVELELERALTGPVHDVAAADSVARIARWLVELEHALALARSAGAEVIRPARVRDVLEALEGRHRACVQIIGHVGPRDMLYLDGEQLSLRRLAAEISELTASGWRSPVRTIDLSVCNSESLFARLARSCGIEYVSGRTGDLHVGAVASWVRALYAQNLFDGATPIAHAWLVAALARGSA